MSRRPTAAAWGGVLVAALMAGCAPSGEELGLAGAAGRPDVGALTSRQAAQAASFYTPSRGPLALDEASDLPPPADAPLRAAVYVASCATPAALADHVAFFQGLGFAVAVPRFGGDRCVVATDRLGTVHAEIDRVVQELRTLSWLDPDAFYLVGHGIGADVASTYTREGTFKGMVALAAACPFGIQNVTPILTFRALDDAVLSNRGTRCIAFDPPNAMHVEFSGNDHVMRLTGGEDLGDARTLMRNAIARFVGAGDAPRDTIAQRDAVDLQQMGSEAAPPAVTDEAAPDDAVRDAPVSSERAESGAAPADLRPGDDPADAVEAEASPGEPAPPPPIEPPARAETDPGAASADVLFIPDLRLPEGRF